MCGQGETEVSFVFFPHTKFQVYGLWWFLYAVPGWGWVRATFGYVGFGWVRLGLIWFEFRLVTLALVRLG